MRYLQKILLILVCCISISWLMGIFLDHQYKKRWSVLFFEKTDELVKGKTDFDIIYLGNSRVHFGINPFYIDSITKKQGYNFGYGGAGMVETMMVTSVYLLQHPAPKMAVISLDLGAATKNNNLKSSFHYLYYLNNDSIKKYMQQQGFLTGMIQLLPFTKYSFFDEYNRTSLFVKGSEYPKFGHNIYHGFLNIQKGLNSVPVTYNLTAGEDKLWDTAITALRNTVTALQNKGTLVIFVAPPEKQSSAYRNAPLRHTVDSIFTCIADEYKVMYFHFEHNELFKDELFTDDIHLNEPGTQLYSRQLGDSIKKVFHE